MQQTQQARLRRLFILSAEEQPNSIALELYQTLTAQFNALNNRNLDSVQRIEKVLGSAHREQQ